MVKKVLVVAAILLALALWSPQAMVAFGLLGTVVGGLLWASIRLFSESSYYADTMAPLAEAEHDPALAAEFNPIIARFYD